MRKTLFPLVVAAILSSGSSADDTKTIIVTAITHESRSDVTE